MKRIEMGHAAHFILGNFCQFRRATYINGYIVSTVGELRSPFNIRQHGESGPYEPIGHAGELYETMVFHARKVDALDPCGCPYVQRSGSNIFGERWKTSKEAQEQHERIVRLYSKRKNGLKRKERLP